MVMLKRLREFGCAVETNSRRHLPRLPQFVDRHIGEVSFSHELRLRLIAWDRPCLDMYCYRSGADTDQIGIRADDVPYAHRLLESHRVDGDRSGSPFRVRMREDPAGNIHLAQEPPPEDITILIGIGRHAKRAY